MNPEVSSVNNSCDYNDNSKKWLKSFIDKCPPFGTYPNKSPPQAKIRTRKPQSGGKEHAM